MPDRNFIFGPVALTATTTANLLNPGTTTGGTNATASPFGNTRIQVLHLRAVNTTNGAVSIALWKGATGTNTAGKEFVWGGAATAGALNAGTGVSVPANSYIEAYGYWNFDTADFLVGGGSATGVTLEGEGFVMIA